MIHAIPNSGAVTAVHDGVHRGAIKTQPSHTGHRPDWGLIGTAIDFRLRLAFTAKDVVPQSAQHGHAALLRHHPEAYELLSDLEAATSAILAEVNPQHHDQIELPDSLEKLIRLCVVAAQLDQLYRAYAFVIDKTTLIEHASVITLDRARTQVPWFVIDQIHDQVRVANQGLGTIRANATHARAGMSFAGSHLVGGADADLLVDGLLLDFKSTHKATTMGKADVYQLAGYALLDFDDEHHIDSVGIYWTRHGVTRTFTLPVFFELLGATESVPELRGHLRRDLTAFAEEQQRRAATWQRERVISGSAAHTNAPRHTALHSAMRWLRGVLRK